MSMWNKLSIKTQLIIMMTVLVSLIEVATLVAVNKIDASERHEFAVDLAENLTNSINNDLLKTILAPVADNFADISFRISGFKDVNSLLLLDENEQPIFKYGETALIENNLAGLKQRSILLSDNGLLMRSPVASEGYTFGYAITNIDLTDYQAKQQEHLTTLLIIFIISPFIALLLSWGFSFSFTRPFSLLASSMKKNDVANNHFEAVSTDAKNEVGSLFNGYNKMIQKIESTTEQMRFQSEHDSLTGLYNRFYIDKALQNALQDETCKSHVLINMDLDQFKLINDSAGHTAGDELLKMIAHGCSEQMPENAIMARIGGDDFYILLPNTTEEEGIAFAKSRQERLADFRFIWEGEALSTSATLGLIAFKPFEYTLSDLIKASGSAFYTAKSLGRNKLHVYRQDDVKTQQFDHEVQVARYIKDALKEAPNASRFELYAQAIVPLQTETDKVSYEILIRMWDGEGKFVPPDAFLPTAERYQLMAEIDNYVLSTYLKMATENPEHIENLHVAHINLAGSSLNNPDFQANLKKMVQTYKFPWSKLELEVTETSAVGNFNQAKEFIGFCKNLGIGLALDDFGTGMSSFEYLKSLPFDVVKIDGSFVKDMHTDPSDRAIIRYIQEISALRNQETVAEYVETQEDVSALTEIGITYGQGYFLGKPKPFSDWLNPPTDKP